MATQQKYRLILPTLLLLAWLLGGLVASLLTIQEFSESDWARLMQPGKILSGESTHEFIKLLNQKFVLGSTFSQIEHGIQWNLTRDLGLKVRAGCDDWLFYSEELEVHPARAEAARFRVNLAASVAQKLRAQGINLLLVVVPDKSRIEAAHLCGLNRSPLFSKRASDFVNNLKRNGVERRDLTADLMALSGEKYYRTDTHWNERGANVAAAAIAEQLTALHWIAATGKEIVLSEMAVERPGDLVHLAGLDKLPAILRPKTEWATTTQIAPLVVAGDDLFGDAGLPTITLLGTSFARNGNFASLLEQHLGLSVANLAKDGGDFAGAAKEYFTGATFHDNPPKLVIWEIPERVIEMPIKVEEQAWADLLTGVKN